MIFFSLDYESFKTCVEVSTAWKELLTSELYHRKAKSLFNGEIVCDEWKLWHAAWKGNVEKVQSLAGSIFVDVNCVKGPRETTPLCVAAQNPSAPSTHSANDSHKDVIQLLLERGAKPNMPDKDGWTPLYWATQHANREVMQVLIERGADPDLGNSSGWTPLHWAAFHGNKAVMQLLLDRGAKPNSATMAGWTPLHSAVCKGRIDMVKLLLNAGAEDNRVTNSGKTPLHLAQQRGHKDIVNILRAVERWQKANGRQPYYCV